MNESFDQRVGSVESEWCKRFGKDSVTALRYSLEAVKSADQETQSAGVVANFQIDGDSGGTTWGNVYLDQFNVYRW